MNLLGFIFPGTLLTTSELKEYERKLCVVFFCMGSTGREDSWKGFLDFIRKMNENEVVEGGDYMEDWGQIGLGVRCVLRQFLFIFYRFH